MKTLFLFSLLLIGLATIHAEDSEEDTNDVAIVNKSSESGEDSNANSEKKDVKPWKKHDWKKREPEFLAEVSQEAKTEFFGIKFNPELKKGEKNEKLKAWAEKYDLEEKMDAFLADKKADCDRKKQERKENYEKLGELIEKADEIMEDQENTWQSANDKLDALVKDENREVLKAFQTFYPFVGNEFKGHRHGHGHRFHHGKRFGRQIGHGAAPRHHQIGHGAEAPRIEIGRENYDPYGNQKHHHKKHHGGGF